MDGVLNTVPLAERATLGGMRLIGRIIAAGRLHIQSSGIDNVPLHGPLILACRHFHHLFDGLALILTVPRPTHVLVTLDWAQSRFIRGAMATLTRMARWPVVSRGPALTSHMDATRFASTARNHRHALRAAVRLLIQERALVVFPEGYPNIDPHYTPKNAEQELLPFKSGFAALAAAAQRRSRARIAIVPVGLCYRKEDEDCWQVRLSFGAPVALGDFPSRRRLVEHVEEQVRALSTMEH